MITLITGQPGAGKTLYALNFVKARAEKEGREVFYSGVADLKLPWKELDKGEDWHKVPPGSIVVVDECQRVFRPRGNGAGVPEHVAKLETHRHDGIDLVLITQHPMLADTNVRRLVGQHFHVVRAFGTKKATVHEWGEVKTECDKSRVGSIRHDFLYPRDSFGWYKSAEIHTHKARIPFRVYFLFLLPVLLGACVWWAYKSLMGSPSHKPVSPVGSSVSGSAPGAKKEKTAAEYLSERSPRVAGLAYTAPAYDEVTKPADAPFPAACMASKSKCSCFSQQATALDVPDLVCRQIVARGYFKDWSSKESPHALNARVASVNPSPVGKDIDRSGYAVIPAPPVLRGSPGFHAADAPIDDGVPPAPRVRPPVPSPANAQAVPG